MPGLRRLFGGPTIADQMILHRNRSRGFDYIRIGLSIAVAVWHSFFLPTLVHAKSTPFGFAVDMILPMFFALSGFLVSGSLLRTTRIHEFITLRAIRILPALAVEVLLSAFILGVIFTTLPLGRYFTHPLFLTYMRNLVGDVQFLLPGVFLANPIPLINVSLWTVPYELMCYLAIVVLWLAGAVPNRRWLLLLLVVVFQFALPVRDLITGDLIKPLNNNLPGRILVLSFLWSVVLYFFSPRIILRAWIAALMVPLCFVMLKFSLSSYFVALPAAYLTVFLGLTNPPRIPVLMSGDYSYGIYLYAGPMQQASVALFPGRHEWWFNLATTLPAIGLFAAFSWFVVEQPILSHRRRIVAAVDRLVLPLAAAARRATRRTGSGGPPIAAVPPPR